MALTEKQQREYEHQLTLNKERKRQIQQHIDNINKQKEEKQISKEDAEHKLEKEINGRTATEWKEYYDKHITYYKELLR